MGILDRITIKTEDCTNCEGTYEEQGLKLQMTGLMDLTNCTTDNLDNVHQHDYLPGRTAKFDNRVGIGGCGIDMYQSIDSGSALWTGPGIWTPDSTNTVCVDFFGDNSPTCCCNLLKSMSLDDGWVKMSGCTCSA